MAAWADRTMANPTAVAISTSAVAFVTGLLFGIYSTRGYLISPELAEERRRNLTDPFESEASDVDDGILLDHAPNWANGDEADVRDGLRASSVAGSSTSSKKKKKSSKDKEKEKARHTHSHSGDEECKLVLVVRTDLGMTKGKIAAQCGHATLACYKILRRAAGRDPTSSAARLLQRWERRGQAKIAVQAKGEDTLVTLMGIAHSLGVTAEVIADAGRTQIESGSLTVLGVGPAPKSLVDKITGHLKLL
ncbi:peptidyl-tRNA hydrolase, PTH2 family [Sporothrix schenckii 1099-18]|uniref:peptidyl-tRNA hydrolase n=3 Tax=Sporothrix TaxID=29907 RepID=U7PHC7_SPOS1|nr:peptidyl-tRNA hydrolase, PTH2 family [Sporothrix schenckii 1099-18]XP_040621507.1 peptidyl-tRNA hydrolase, PTH2 family [Sporothrix brasiliensis 5110]ERS94973.1 peptidyl-tRNA hydrolase [Sporothrix schenckii ATCC 58251]KIH93497.1 peptidyl-tRNA hydrolase, PTH2 family [Sporothrix brasiliensis 5110]KJR83922.1 peptidyl-tRNA hydrolase, PTH2 family [Sporothrix schenckii 1099-18]